MCTRVFYNKGHPERQQKDLSKYTALQQVAHLTDAVVAMVKNVSPRPDPVLLPGRHRFRLLHKGVEVLGPIKKTMTTITRLNYISQHFATSRAGNIAQLDHLTFWPAIESSLSSKKGIPARVAVAKFLYEWWATNHKVHQRQRESDEEEGAQCPCGCGTETAYHIRTECKLEHFVNVRRAFADERRLLILNADFSPAVKQLFSEIMELSDDGTYPDLTSEAHLWSDDQPVFAKEVVKAHWKKGYCFELPVSFSLHSKLISVQIPVLVLSRYFAGMLVAAQQREQHRQLPSAQLMSCQFEWFRPCLYTYSSCLCSHV